MRVDRASGFAEYSSCSWVGAPLCLEGDDAEQWRTTGDGAMACDAGVGCEQSGAEALPTLGTQPEQLEPLTDFSVAMPSLCRGDLDFSRLPQQIKVALAFLRAFCPWDVVRDDMVARCPPLLPPQREEHRGRRTLVLDLDETLVHCHPSRLPNCPPPALQLVIDVTDPPLHAHVYVRPFARMLLEVAKRESWEVVVFTASAAIYADKVLDFLDPDRRCVVHRLYRQHCTEIAGGHFKDMRRLGRRLEDVVLVDNSPLAAGLSPDSSILVSSWFGDDQQDAELLDLLALLEECLHQPSIPQFLAQRYGFKAFLECQQRRAALMGESALALLTQMAAPGPVTQVRR